MHQQRRIKDDDEDWGLRVRACQKKPLEVNVFIIIRQRVQKQERLCEQNL